MNPKNADEKNQNSRVNPDVQAVRTIHVFILKQKSEAQQILA